MIWQNLWLSTRHFIFYVFSGIVPGNSKVEVKVTFTPMDFSTAHMKLQVNEWKQSYRQIHRETFWAGHYNYVLWFEFIFGLILVKPV